MLKKLKLTQKQEGFTCDLFTGMSQREAYIKNYHPTYAITTIDANASRLANNEKVLVRLGQLRRRAEDASVMNVLERKQRLTEIARARLTDYQTDKGIKLNKDSPNTAAVSGFKSRIRYSRKGLEPEIVTELDLHSPVQAIAELNKMEKIYSEGNTVNIDNRRLNVSVMPDLSKLSDEELNILECILGKTALLSGSQGGESTPASA